MASITKNENGTYKIRVSYKDESSGRTITKSKVFKPSKSDLPYVKLTKEINDFAEKFEKEARNSSANASSSITLARFCDKYFEEKQSVLAPNTYAFYQKVANDYLIPMFGNLKLSEIKTYHVQKFITFLSCEKQREDGQDGSIAGTTVKRYTSVLRSILALAYRMEYIDEDVALSRRLEFPKEVKKEVEVYTLDEVGQILSALKEEPVRIRAMIEVALFTGCRRGEIVGLKWADFDIERKTVSVKRSIYKLPGGKAADKTPKTLSSYRTISIPECLCETMLDYKRWQNKHIAFMDSEWNNLDYVFTEEDGLVMNPQTPTKQFDHFLKRHGIRHLKFHGLRHTSATLLLSHGCDIKTVSTRLGHSDIETTNIYVHALQEMDKKAADTFDAFCYSANKEPKELKK